MSNTPQRILVTGAAGAVGWQVCRALIAAGHDVRRLDLRGPDDDHDLIRGDIADAGVLMDAAEGCDAIIHLAACPNPADFETRLMRPNVLGLIHVLEAAKQRAVNKLILTSSIQVGGRGVPGEVQAATMPGRPWNNYALTKAWLEQAGEMYARLHGMNVMAVRLGWVPQHPRVMDREPNVDMLTIYLSHDDAGRFFTRSVEADWGGFQLMYALGVVPPGVEPFWDRSAARDLLGFEPRHAYPDGLNFEGYDSHRRR